MAEPVPYTNKARAVQTSLCTAVKFTATSGYDPTALTKLYTDFLFKWMGYDRGVSFPFDFLNQMEFHLVQNRMENCHHDHIPFNLKGNGNIVFSVLRPDRATGLRFLTSTVRENKPLNGAPLALPIQGPPQTFVYQFAEKYEEGLKGAVIWRSWCREALDSRQFQL